MAGSPTPTATSGGQSLASSLIFIAILLLRRIVGSASDRVNLSLDDTSDQIDELRAKLIDKRSIEHRAGTKIIIFASE